MGVDLGKRIQKLLRERGMNQKELAERIGTTEATMSRYVNGERDPKSEVLANIATALRTTSDYLLGIEEKKDIASEFPRLKRLIARNANDLSNEQKRELVNALFGAETGG